MSSEPQDGPLEPTLPTRNEPESASPAAYPETRTDRPEPMATSATQQTHNTPVRVDRPVTQAAGVPGPSGPLPSAQHGVPGYEILGELGHGGMGVVYKARQIKANRLVALKMILGQAHARPQHKARFQAEVEAVARLQHPNIVQLYEVGELAGMPYFSLEYCDGGSLDARLRLGPLPVPAAAALVESLAQAMHFAHSRNIVHRDLKPANVLLTADSTPKVADFGLARQLDADSGQTQTGAVLGTPSYMAPEQASGGTRTAGPAADVYSLGAILYECLTGRPPFRGETNLETLEQVRSREPPRPSAVRAGVPRDVETVCLRCLAKEPEKRYSSARELADDLGRFRRGEPVLARPVGVGERLVRWAKRRPAVAGLLAAVLVLVVAGSTTLLSFWLRIEKAQRDESDTRARRAEESEKEARERERLAREALERVEDTLAENLLIPFGAEHEDIFWSGRLSAAELESLHKLTDNRSDRVRTRFLEIALQRAGTATGLARRRDVVIHAVVGLREDRRSVVVTMLREKLAGSGASRALRRACVRLTVPLIREDEEFVHQAVEAAIELAGREDDSLSALPSLAADVAAMTDHLPGDQAERYCARMAQTVLDAGAGHKGASQWNLVAEAVLPLAARLDPAAAATVAAAAVAPIRERLGQADQILIELTRSDTLESLCQYLAPEEAAKLVHVLLVGLARTNDGLLTALTLSRTLRLAINRLGPREAAVAVAEAVEGIRSARNESAKQSLALAAAQAAPRLAPEDRAAVAQSLVDAVTRTADTSSLCSLAAVARSMTLRPELQERTARVVVEKLLGVLPKEKDAETVILLAGTVGALAERLDRERATQASVIAAEALLGAFDGAGKQFPNALAGASALASALVASSALAARLTPGDAARVMARLIENADRTDNPVTLALLAAVATPLSARLGREEASASGAKLVALLDRPSEPLVTSLLFRAVLAVAPRLESDAAAKLSADATRKLLAAVARTNDPIALAALTSALQPQLLGLKPFAVRRAPVEVVRLFRDAMTRTTAPTQLYVLAGVVQAQAARLPAGEANPLAAAAARELLAALDRAADPGTRISLAAAAIELIPSMDARAADETALAVARHLLELMDRGPDLPVLGACAQLGHYLAQRLKPEQARKISSQFAHRLVDKLGSRTDAPSVAALLMIGPLLESMDRDEASTVAKLAAEKLIGTLDGGSATHLVSAAPLLRQLAPHMKSGQAAALAHSLADVIARTIGSETRANGPLVSLDPLTPRLTTDQLVDLLKEPTCVGYCRLSVLYELGRRLGRPSPEPAGLAFVGATACPPPVQVAWELVLGAWLYPDGREPFANLWQAVDRLHEPRLHLDFDSPPHRAP